MIAEIENMFVDSEYRRHGIGRKFFEMFLAECKNNCISSVRVTASFANKNAISAYEKWGFVSKNLTMNFNV
jgi:GNAT superfamily N-acetyltransferase